uniref:Uncharacterized protein n=1 Tax=Cannabis sativa TaxID=3483 RepID=A0A803NMS8_CANSA
MEVFVGPTFGIDVSSPPAYVMESAQDKHASVASCLYGAGSEICLPNKTHQTAEDEDDSSNCSSSIGAPDDSDDDASSQGDADEVQSKFRGGSLSTLDSIEEALPIKRGLSNHFSGKSKSFTNLSEAPNMVLSRVVNDLYGGDYCWCRARVEQSLLHVVQAWAALARCDRGRKARLKEMEEAGGPMAACHVARMVERVSAPGRR